MPSRLDTPVLTVDVGLIHKVDTRNVENLFSMWTVFSRCAGSLEEGRRLENLSWRLWNRETFCCDPVSEANSTTPAISIASRSSEVLEFESDSSSSSDPVEIHPETMRHHDLHSRSRGRERHITPDDLEKMVITIKEKKDLEPLSPSHPYLSPPAMELPEAAPVATPRIVEPVDLSVTSADGASEQSAPPSQDLSTASERSATSVVKGFSPAHVSSSYRSIPLLTAPSSLPTTDLANAPASRGPRPKKQAMFAIGASSGEDSLSEEAHSLENKLKPTTAPTQQKKKAKFSFGGSSNEDESSLPQNMAKAQKVESRPPMKKVTSFQEEVASRTINEESPFEDDVFESEEDDIDESAIDDDDDSSDWEDSVEDSGNASIDEKTFFQRVDSRPNLTSRRSMITTLLHQNDRASALATAAAPTSAPALHRSRTSSPHGPSLPGSPDSDDAAPLMMKKGLKPIAEIPRSAAQPIIQTTTNTTSHQLALSPRTTRRNMLASELTVSLRQHLLWERKQRSQTANAVLKRRHTEKDLKNLKQDPERAHMDQGSGSKSSWNEYYGQGLGEYHSRGW
ncbi:hypothetical protein LZ554_000684 [Drepanopeziza brunnea f. sp. 'monogermtubi']|nr:hypothetical protein LZ554_000684 [Drepanopeziza brunnea f. sp. 'monogermtubi']